jgi:orotidine-5'-phosphate decarboxylase
MALLGVTVLTSSSVQTLEETGCALEGERPLKTLVAKRAFLARESGLSGVICSGHEALEVKALCGPEFLAVTPGIRPLWSVEKKDDQERVMTPSLALAAGADMLVIGRPIRDAADPEAAVERILKEMADAG